MSILQECPGCRQKQKTSKKRCRCGEALDLARKSGRVKFWINFRLPGGVQRRQLVGTHLKDAIAAHSKRLVQKAENRFLDMLPAARLTFGELAGWYLTLPTVEVLASHARIKIALNNFCAVFGQRVAGTVLPAELEAYQATRIADGLAPATIDVELAIVRGWVSKAFDNDKLDGQVVKAFRRVKPLALRGSNARKRTITIGEYISLLEAAPAFLKGMVILAMNTGMRPGELRQLRWSYIDRVNGFIRLPAAATKEGHDKTIPINHHVKAVLDGTLRHLGLDFVFANGGQPIQGPKAVSEALKGACVRAGVAYGRKALGGMTMHDIRRTVKTNMLAAGVDKTYRDLILGHALQGMDRHYIKPSEDALTQAMAVYTAWLGGQLANVEQAAYVVSRVM
jgi:integrase